MLFFGAAASCLNFYLALAIGHSFSSKKLLMKLKSKKKKMLLKLNTASLEVQRLEFR